MDFLNREKISRPKKNSNNCIEGHTVTNINNMLFPFKK